MQSGAWLGRYFTISQDDSCIFRGQQPTYRRLGVVYHLLHLTRTHSYLWVLRTSFYQLLITMFEPEIHCKYFTLCFMWYRSVKAVAGARQDAKMLLLSRFIASLVVGVYCRLARRQGACWCRCNRKTASAVRAPYCASLSTRSTFIIEWLPRRVIRIANYLFESIRASFP